MSSDRTGLSCGRKHLPPPLVWGERREMGERVEVFGEERRISKTMEPKHELKEKSIALILHTIQPYQTISLALFPDYLYTFHRPMKAEKMYIRVSSTQWHPCWVYLWMQHSWVYSCICIHVMLRQMLEWTSWSCMSPSLSKDFDIIPEMYYIKTLQAIRHCT